jgi:hypothetical protein
VFFKLITDKPHSEGGKGICGNKQTWLDSGGESVFHGRPSGLTRNRPAGKILKVMTLL